MTDAFYAGLPPDLIRVLRDPSIVVPQDQSVFELIASWQNAPSNTASAHSSKEAEMNENEKVPPE